MFTLAYSTRTTYIGQLVSYDAYLTLVNFVVCNNNIGMCVGYVMLPPNQYFLWLLLLTVHGNNNVKVNIEFPLG